MTGREQRAHERTTVKWPVAIQKEAGSEFPGTVENLGALGALVSSPELEPSLVIGDRVTLRLEHDGTTISAAGEIVRVDQEFAAGDIRRTFAVKFDAEIEIR